MIIGEGPSRNMYKGHKAKGGRIKGGRRDGWGVCVWWGENGDNCIGTTIKKHFSLFLFMLLAVSAFFVCGGGSGQSFFILLLSTIL